MTLVSAMQTASEHHRAGRFNEAESIYRAILAQYPDDPGTTHQLGVLIGQRGRPDEGIALIQRAIQLLPNFPDAYSNLGFMLGGRNRVDEAIAAFSKAIELKPDFVEPVLGIGKALGEKGRFDEAIARFSRAIQLRPDYLEAYLELAEVLFSQDRLDEAIPAFHRAIQIEPTSPRAHYGMGNALISRGQPKEAVASFQNAIRFAPDHGPTYNNLAHALVKMGRCADAVAAYRQALKFLPDNPEVLSSMGNALTVIGEFEEAILVCRRAIQLKPDLAYAHSNLGNALIDKGELDEAQAAFHRAIELKPEYAEAHNNLGNALFWSGRLEPAAVEFRRAIELNPDLPDGHWNLANCLLLNGDFQNGLAVYEWRWKIKTMSPPRPFPQPRWAGEELAGRTILLHSEQGLGDILQFVRYAPLIADRGGRVILECPATLTRLFSQIPQIQQIVVTGAPLPDFDMHCPLMSVALAFKTDLDSIPASVPYLKSDPKLSELRKKRLESEKSGRRIGLVWAGASTHTNDHNRSIKLSQFVPLAQTPDAIFFSLQKGDAGKQIPPAGMGLRDYTSDLIDFADTAALLENLDLLITVDTSVAHLAGAMGKPVWLLLPFVPDWRWLLHRDDSPWYPTLRLFRQQTRGNWLEVMSRVGEALKEFKR